MLVTQLENTHMLLNPRPVPIGKITLLSNEKSIRKSLGSFSKEDDIACDLGKKLRSLFFPVCVW